MPRYAGYRAELRSFEIRARELPGYSEYSELDMLVPPRSNRERERERERERREYSKCIISPRRKGGLEKQRERERERGGSKRQIYPHGLNM